ncbi:MAG TPA: sigma 54-interacting transcriptional regulator [Thermodesulfobacteriota bacterium]|nr:sigma 54-interacting transcriptional regulator [Thermodesulfobacteriota bacterium]
MEKFSEKDTRDFNKNRPLGILFTLNPMHSTELELLYRTAPIGLCLIDTGLRYIRINEMLAAIHGKSIEEHIGRSVYEIIPDIAPKLEPVYRKVIKTGKPLLNIEIQGTTSAEPGKEKYFLVSYHPLRNNADTVWGISVVVQDITERKQMQDLQKERIRFEALLSEISARFLYLSPNEMDGGIEQCLQDLVEFLGYDRGSIGLFLEGAKKFCVTHTYACPGFEPAPKGDFVTIFPWYTSMLQKGETLVFSNLPHDLPDEATAEREYCIKGGFKSHLAIPLKVGNSTLGAIGFGSYSSNMSCPKELIQRLRIIGEIFAYAMLRKQALDVILHRDNLLQTIFSSISSHVVVLDREGNIIYTSRSWEEFARDNDGDMNRVMVGVNYLDVCQKAAAENDQSAQEVLQGVRAVLDREMPNFSSEYPCHSPTEQRWYLMQVDPMPSLHGGVVISHINITDRKKSEQELKKALIEIKRLKNQLHAENISLREEVKLEGSYDEIIGASRAIKSVLRQAEQVANTGATVLLYGETGTGKELIARVIHKLSPRKGRALIKVNCAALPSTLIEAELFGREKGAYTGALTKQIGRFEMANGSTIFLDEISELSLELQSKLLRVLQEGEFERLGSPQTIKVDVRVIAATNRDLSKAMEEGNFREDLYYRLNVFPIHIPPLRERKEDIPMLVWSFVKEFSEKMGKRIEKIPRKTMEDLQLYPWHGNVRELRNVIERAMILTKGSTLLVDLPKNGSSRSYQSMTLEDAERKHIIDVLDTTNWRIRGSGGASEVLGLKPSTLESKMVKLGIQRKK